MIQLRKPRKSPGRKARTALKPPAARSPIPPALQVLADSGVIRPTSGSGLLDGMAALNRASRKGVGAIVRVGGKDLAVLPIKYLELLERLIEQEEDRIDAEDADRILDDPTEIPIPFEDAVRRLGLDDVSS